MKNKKEIQNLWLGEDIIFDNRRYCILEINGKKKEVIAIQMTYNHPASLGNPIVNFPFGELVEFLPRSRLKCRKDEQGVK